MITHTQHLYEWVLLFILNATPWHDSQIQISIFTDKWLDQVASYKSTFYRVFSPFDKLIYASFYL